MMGHEIVKRGERDFTCAICEQSWVSAPKSYCPGMKVYGYGAWGALLTRNQLSDAGYSITKLALPAPVACYRRVKEADYVFLYDPAHAQPKALRKVPRVTYRFESVFWPMPLLYVFEDYREMMQDRQKVSGPLMTEIANMAVHLGCFAEAEAKPLADGVLLTITPAMMVHRQYENRFWDERQKLVTRLVKAYKQFIWRPIPLTDEEIERRRVKKDERERAREAATAERRARLFDPVAWTTDAPDLPPATQKSLWDEAEV